ncbi:MAG: acetyl-CoA carboxylase biotin carboxyl carrier protein [Magnetococcales bacterium]|nr:acetyl-CoA carboxylase biotin carboxyl carrier protein [Magnetococcales bacterium]
MDLKDIRQLLKMLADTDVAEIEVRQDDGVMVRIIRDRGQFASGFRSVVTIPSGEMVAPGHDATRPVTGQAGGTPHDPAAQARSPTAIAVTSPMVGTFYNAPSPEAPAFVKVGDRVEKGDVLCIIEAMKLMNEIEADVSGRILRIIKDNASPVEYGEELFLIEP